MYEFSFDIIIALVVAGVPLWLVARRAKPFGPAQALAAVGWGVVVYGSFIAPRFLEVREYAIDLRRGDAVQSEGRHMTIAVVSDFHLGKYRHEEWLEKIVARINAARPDAVIVAGDLATSAAAKRSFAPLAKLESAYGSFAVLGNWDYKVGAVDVRRAIESHKMEVLTDESVLIGPAGAAIRLVGLDDLKYGTPDWDQAFSEVLPGEVVIVAAHQPDAAPQAEARGAALVIAGHTHGGQIRLPFVGAVPRLPIKIDQRFDQGVFDFGPTRLFITPGVGESGPRARLFRTPEISLLRITY
jgi:uncharacterized protein